VSNLHRVCEGRVIHLNLFPPWNERIHMVDHLLRELRRYHFSVKGQNPKLYLTPADQDWGKGFCRRKGLTEEERTNAILLHPGSGSKKKVWPVERFVELFHYLQKHTESRVFVILGPAEGTETQKAFEGIQWDLGSRAPVLLKGLSLLGLASVMEGCRLYIGNDSGITHMAAALDIPTLAIFGPTDPVLWAPRGKKVGVLRKEIECSPCPQEKFLQCQRIECLYRVELEDVLEGLKQLGMGR
jgi:ADP-heptose:LPS heptosyltransferase